MIPRHSEEVPATPRIATPSAETLVAEAREAANLASEHASVTTRVFATLLRDVVDARRRGDYGIAAGLRTRSGDVLYTASNELFSRRDPGGHAELLVLRRHPDVARAPGSILFATIEPCPMCTVAIINSGIQDVVVASEDAQSGAMLGGRLSRLAPVWPRLASSLGLSVVSVQSDDPALPDYLDPRVASVLRRLFDESRTMLDGVLAAGGDREPACRPTGPP